VVAAALALLTAVWPDWIEMLLGVDPDGHSGAVEWAIVFALAVIAAALGVSARVQWVRGSIGTGASRI
jgi:hypothetical protein